MPSEESLPPFKRKLELSEENSMDLNLDYRVLPIEFPSQKETICLNGGFPVKTTKWTYICNRYPVSKD